MLTEAAIIWCCVFTPEIEIRVGLPPLQWEEFTIQSEGTGVSPQPER